MVKYTTQKLFSLPLHKTVSQPTAGSLVLTNYGVRWSWNTETAAPTVQQCSARTQDPGHKPLQQCRYADWCCRRLISEVVFKICHSMLSTKWQDHTICQSLFDTFFQNLSLHLIGWHSCQLSLSIPALPPAQANTLHMLSSYMDHTIVRQKICFLTVNINTSV